MKNVVVQNIAFMGRNENVDYDYYFRLGFETKGQLDLFLEYADRKVAGNMDDPDSPASAQSQMREQPGSYFGYLSDADDRVYTEKEWKALHRPPKSGLGSPPAGGGTITPLGGSTGTATPDYTVTPGQPISEKVLNNYLDRAIRVTNLSQMWWAQPGGCDGPEYGGPWSQEPGGYDPSGTGATVYNAPVPNLSSCLYNPAFDHGRILQSVVQLGAKLVWDMVFLWGEIYSSSPTDLLRFTVAGEINQQIPWYLEWVCLTLKYDIQYIHYYDPEVICAAGIAEWVGNVGGFPVPANIATLFSLDSYSTVDGTSTGRAFNFTTGKFIFDTSNMILAGTGRFVDGGHADITCVQTRMWYYMLATLYIDAGCECLHMGDIFTTNQHDTGNAHSWDLYTKIRAYAATNARRGFVLIESHVSNVEWGVGYPNGVYFDLIPASPAPDFQRQLLFDFHTLGVYFNRLSGSCYNGVLPNTGTANQALILPPGTGLTNHSPGGLNPQGWFCANNPYFLHYDNGSTDVDAGCGHIPTFGPPLNWGLDCYGYDNTTWFANQRDDLKRLIVPYTNYRIKCYDPYGHFALPGRLITTPPTATGIAPNLVYYMGFPTLFDTFNNLWNGPETTPIDWVAHDFTLQNVTNGAADVPPATSFVQVGDNLIFFIATDGYIHGYVRVTDTAEGGCWLTVSPTYSAEIFFGETHTSQVQAVSGTLASNPSGSRIGYIGIDGRIYGFELNTANLWEYYYIHLVANLDWPSGFFAESNLLFPSDETGYCIGGFGAPVGIYCLYLVGATFQVVISLLADLAGAGVTPVTGLAYSKSASYDRLYYIGTDGGLHYFEIVDAPLNYNYVGSGMFADLLAAYGLTILNLAVSYTGGITRVYFTGRRAGTNFICCLEETSLGNWNMRILSGTISLTTGGITVNQQVPGVANIAVSGNGSHIAFANQYGADPTLANVGIFSLVQDLFGGEHYVFSQVSDGLEAATVAGFTFSTAISLFLIANTGGTNATVLNVRYEPAYCQNPAMYAYPLPFSYVAGPALPTSVVINKIGFHFYLKFTFPTCNPERNYWSVGYWQPGLPEMYALIVLDCFGSAPYVGEIEIFPAPLSGGSGSFLFNYTLEDCYGNMTSGTVSYG
jgi:hypothetical protein